MQYFTFYFQFLLKAKHVISLRGVMRTSNMFLNEENSFDVVTLCEQTHVMHIQHLLKQESSIVHLSFRTVYLWCPDTFVCISAVANKAGKHTSLIVNFRHACILRHIGRQLIRPFLVLPQTTVISPVSFIYIHPSIALTSIKVQEPDGKFIPRRKNPSIKMGWGGT